MLQTSKLLGSFTNGHTPIIPWLQSSRNLMALKIFFADQLQIVTNTKYGHTTSMLGVTAQGLVSRNVVKQHTTNDQIKKA